MAVGLPGGTWGVDVVGFFVLLLLLLLLELEVEAVVEAAVDITISFVLLDVLDSDVDIPFASEFCAFVGLCGAVGAVMVTELEGRAEKFVGECTLGTMRTTSSFSESNFRLRSTSELKHTDQRSAYSTLTA